MTTAKITKTDRVVKRRRKYKLNWREILRKLEEARRTVEMDNAHFVVIGPDAGADLPRAEKDVTAFIKRRTDAWRRCWVMAPMDEAIDALRDRLGLPEKALTKEPQ